MNTRIKTNVNKEEIADLKNVVINTELDIEKRVECFLKQVRNPLRYKCGIYNIEVASAEDSCPIEKCFNEYMIACKK